MAIRRYYASVFGIWRSKNGWLFQSRSEQTLGTAEEDGNGQSFDAEV
jgi:hypothetical protein